MKKPKVTRREVRTQANRLLLQTKVAEILAVPLPKHPNIEEEAVYHLRKVCPSATTEEIADAMQGVCTLAIVNSDPVVDVIDVLLETRRLKASAFAATSLDTLEGATAAMVRKMVASVKGKTSFTMEHALRILIGKDPS